MVGIIVVFPNKDNATNIRNLLVRVGLNVTGVCTTGAQAMNYADSVDEGIIVWIQTKRYDVFRIKRIFAGSL